MRTVIVALLLVSLSLTSARAQTTSSAEPNPLLGTWTLNVVKSSIDYAPLPRAERRTYRAAPNDGMIFSVEGLTEPEFRTPTELRLQWMDESIRCREPEPATAVTLSPGGSSIPRLSMQS